MSAAVSVTRLWSVPSAALRSVPRAAMKTNSTPPGTSASPRASARNANVSDSTTIDHDGQARQRRPAGAVEHRRHGRSELLADEVRSRDGTGPTWLRSGTPQSNVER